MKSNKIFAGSLLLVLAFSLPAQAAVTWLDGIVAVVGNDIITERELDSEVSQIAGELQQRNAKLPEEKILQQQVLEKMILDELQMQRAEALGIRIDDSTLDRAVKGIAADNGMSVTQFRKALTREGLDFRKFRENIRKELAISRLHSRVIDRRVSVSDQEVADLLERNRNLKNADRQFRLRHILIAVPEAATPDQLEAAREEAEKLRAEAREGASFAELATSYSDGQNALKGGDLGWRSADQLPTLFAEPVVAMNVGDVSPIIQSPSGFHLVKVEDIKGADDKPLIEQSKVRHILISPNGTVTVKDAEKQLKKLRKQILSGKGDFAALAKEYSDDPGSAAQGGELGWSAPGTFVPAFEDAIKKLKPGEISKPFRTQFGVHIVQLEDRRMAPASDDLLEGRARELLVKQKREEELALWLRQLREESYVEVRLPGAGEAGG